MRAKSYGDGTSLIFRSLPGRASNDTHLNSGLKRMQKGLRHFLQSHLKISLRENIEGSRYLTDTYVTILLLSLG